MMKTLARFLLSVCAWTQQNPGVTVEGKGVIGERMGASASASSRGTSRLPADVQNAKDLSATWSVSNDGPGSFAVPQLMISQQLTVTAAGKEDPTKFAQAIRAETPPRR